MRTVNARVVRKDAIAGCIGAIVVLPQGVAFATIAGLPPQYGLYAAMVPATIAALWGSSRHLVSGPTTAISLVVFASLAPLAAVGSEHYVALAITLAFMVGVLQLGLGMFRLGTLVRLISPTVVVGFTAGAAILIATSQLKHALGVSVPQGAHFSETLVHVFSNLDLANPFLVLITAVTLAVGILTRRFVPSVPYMIPAIILGSLVGVFLNMLYGVAHTGIVTIGALPHTLPPLSLPVFDFDTVRMLAGSALAITLLGLTEAVAIARSIGVRSGQHIDGNQEFIGQGLSNIVGSFFSAYPSSGSFNRSGLNFEAGAQTPLASVFAAAILALLVVFVAPLAVYMPLAAMAAVLFLVAWGIVDVAHIRHIVRHDKTEAMILIVTFLSTLFIELEFAIFVGVFLSFALFVRHVMFADVCEVGECTSTGSLRALAHNSDVVLYPGTVVARIDMSLVYMNCDVVYERLSALLAEHERREHETVRRCVLNMSGVNYVDSAGAEMLEHFAHDLTGRGATLAFINAKFNVRERLKKQGLIPRYVLYQNLAALKREVSTA
ncbi:MAG: SulP family inorganic anion transporter [Candidatus Pacebacteria bacterium]|nr:SulP family inorganic anion transporter [Candidatus Paceibacterota bacterium]